ncbi:MAG: ATP-binding protein [Solirubrobacteraceae bacterium]
MHDSATVELELDSRPESLTLIRAMLAGVGEAVALDAELLDDLRTAVSEACNNVVLHAYAEGPGPLDIRLEIRGAVHVTVGDRGSGITTIAAVSEDRMGVGLALISALADRAEFLSREGGGTEVRMSFDSAREPSREALVQRPDTSGPRSMDTRSAPEILSGDVVVTVSPVTLLGAVLGRVMRAAAAGARFSLDRFSDLYLVTDAIASHADDSAVSGNISFAISGGPRRLALMLGPLRSGSVSELSATGLAAAGRLTPLKLLTDELAAEPAQDRETLRVVMLDHRDDVPS